jgi:uncharacterized membrane protein YfcA
VIDPITIAALATVTAAAGILRGYSGFGGGLVMAPFFIRLVGPAESVVLISIVHLFTSFQGVRQSIRLIDMGIVGPLLAAAVVSVPLGVLLLSVLEPGIIKPVVAVVVVGLALALGLGMRPRGSPTTTKSIAVGVLCGLLNGFCGTGGPPAVLYLLAGGHASASQRASFILLFAVLYPVTVAILLAGGLVTWPMSVLGAALAPVYFAGTELGHALFRRVHARLFFPICTAVLCLSGLSVLFA